ncbi:peptidase M23 [Vitreoscilla filiformis]|jgi:murein DD-endopeptidase MepM/ murein hydrolase activator NlpD|uniref:Peptidase M23 n=1 Tax=Vitreoscilla filiformis TaxID=63 RepID=A0A221KAT8_VITFI|nr:M23 family metallopeptidase [Vitreoscilla filiformis]ASM75950.1 peptidase M23 [Vitreoscilla filiformis]
MQILITDGRLRTFSLSMRAWQLALVIFSGLLSILLLSGTVYHFVFLKAVRDGWPVVSQVVQWVVRDEVAQRDRVMRDNLDALAQKIGEMQARMVHLEALEKRVFTLAGVAPEEIKALRAAPVASAPAGGSYAGMDTLTLSDLSGDLLKLDERAQQYTDLLALAESRMFESRLSGVMVPSSKPVEVSIGSGFGFRRDPFTGRPALHTGVDFSAPSGTQIQAAAAGVVLSTDWHPQYGRVLEIDHGQGLVTRYAHTQSFLVQAGAVVKRGQPIATIGNTGRSTGAHLHFEVLIDGVPQNPLRFLRQLPSDKHLATN